MIPFSVVPLDPSLGWSLDLVELEEDVSRYNHDSERRLIIVVDGDLTLVDEDDDEEMISAGEMVLLEPRVDYSFIPDGEVKFFIIDFPELQNEFIPLDEDQDFGMRYDKGEYAVYETITGDETDGLWSLAIIEINDSPNHVHKIESEQFIVVNGVLSVELNNRKKILEVGESIRIPKGSVHHLMSANSDPVRVLCFNFPAFDPTDMYPVS